MSEPLDLPKWIKERKVCWELTPYYVMNKDTRVQVGWELTMYAQHGPLGSDDPGCDECEQLHVDLQHLAHSVLPKQEESATYEFVPFEPCFYLRPESRFKNEVALIVRIHHGQGFFDPVDESETKIATAIEKNLKALGAHVRAWDQN